MDWRTFTCLLLPCGGVPLIVSKLLTKVGLVYQGNYLYVMTAFVTVYIVTTIITWLIYRYLPLWWANQTKIS